jgi:hypothetical protein
VELVNLLICCTSLQQNSIGHAVLPRSVLIEGCVKNIALAKRFRKFGHFDLI